MQAGRKQEKSGWKGHGDAESRFAGEEIAMMESKGKAEHWRTVFEKYDYDHDGYIPLQEFRNYLLSQTNLRSEVPQPVIDRILRRADNDQNGKLDFDEFYNLVHSPELPPQTRQFISRFASYASSYANRMVVPRNRRVIPDQVDGEYTDAHTCCPPPITIFIVTLAEIGVFLYYVMKYGDKVPFESPLIYDPYRRYEAWRYLSYMLIHAGYVHIVFNMIIQLILGIPLEMVHKFWRVWLVYIFGVVAGSLGTSISDPKVFLAGASGGVYALITAHLATIIMNFKEMDFAILQLAAFLFLMAADVSVAIYNRYIVNDPTNTTGYAAHFAGAIAGLLMGIIALRNLKQHKWESVLWWISLATFVVFMAAMIIWNIALPSYFLTPK